MKKYSLETSVLNKVEEAPGFLLWQIEMCWQRAVNHSLAPFDLTYTQFIVLFITDVLSKARERVYQHQVAKFSRIDRMMTSRILSSLEKKNFIEREKISGDARAKLVTITPKGKDILEKSLKIVTRTEETFFKPTGADFTKAMQQILPECSPL